MGETGERVIGESAAGGGESCSTTEDKSILVGFDLVGDDLGARDVEHLALLVLVGSGGDGARWKVKGAWRCVDDILSPSVRVLVLYCWYSCD